MSNADHDPLVAQASDPYMTVYKSEFHKRSAPEAPNVRPPTQMGLSDQRFRDDTTYATEYSKKQPNPNTSLWSGGNNPHPSQAFMVWKYPTSKQRQPEEEAPAITNEQYDQVMRGKCQSTYQTDFLGFPQGYRPPEAAGSLLRDPAEEVPYTLDSLQRYSYRQPNQADALRIGTTRYSHSGADRHRLLVGGAPSISQVQLSAKHSTTYERHYNETAPPTSHAPKFPEKSGRSVKGKDADMVAKLYADSRSDVENMDKRYAEPSGTLTGDLVRQSPGKIPEPRWVTTPVPAPLPS